MAYLNGRKVFMPIQVNQEGGSTHNYSTDEQVVGTFTNGKPVYERTITGTFSSEAGQNSIGPQLTDIDEMIDISGTFSISAGTSYKLSINTYYSQGLYAFIRYNGMSKRLTEEHQNTVYSTPNQPTYIITFRYTKTTDTANN